MLTKEEIFEQDVASKLAVGDSVSTAVILDATAKYAKEAALAFYYSEESLTPEQMGANYDRFLLRYEKYGQ
jgi:hypothetical protein